MYLSRVIEQDLQSTFCLLNAVIIFARLGDYTIAAQVLEEAKRVDETLALTLFIMGHVEFQLDHFDKAEDCFRAALSVMQGPNLKYAHHGFDFTLWTSQIREDLLVFDSDLSNINAVLASFPADALFEAPGRAAGSTATSLRPRRGSDSGSLPTLSEGSESPVDELPTPEIELKALRFPIKGEKTYAEDPEFFHSDIEPVPNTPVVTVLGDVEVERPSSRASKIITPLRRLSTRNPEKRAAEHMAARRAAFAPREARVQGDSVQELSEYIRDLPARHGLKPRTAKADFGDVRDLSKFLRADPARSSRRSGRPSLKRASSERSGSGVSSLRDDLSARSIDSQELLNDWDSSRSGSVPPTTSRHPYRSGLGSFLMNENTPGSHAQILRRSASQRSQSTSNEEPAEMLTSVLHPLLTDSADDFGDSSWPLTPDASEMLRHTPPSCTAMYGSSYFELPAPSMSRPSIPMRGSSLRKPSPGMLPNITEQDDLEGWTGTPNRLSTYQFMMRHGVH